MFYKHFLALWLSIHFLTMSLAERDIWGFHEVWFSHNLFCRCHLYPCLGNPGSFEDPSLFLLLTVYCRYRASLCVRTEFRSLHVGALFSRTICHRDFVFSTMLTNTLRPSSASELYSFLWVYVFDHYANPHHSDECSLCNLSTVAMVSFKDAYFILFCVSTYINILHIHLFLNFSLRVSICVCVRGEGREKECVLLLLENQIQVVQACQQVSSPTEPPHWPYLNF